MCGRVYSCACCGSQSWDQESASIALPRRQASQSNTELKMWLTLVWFWGIPSLPSEAGTTGEPRHTPGIAVCHEDTHSGPQACGNPFNHRAVFPFRDVEEKAPGRSPGNETGPNQKPLTQAMLILHKSISLPSTQSLP